MAEVAGEHIGPERLDKAPVESFGTLNKDHVKGHVEHGAVCYRIRTTCANAEGGGQWTNNEA